MKLTFTDRAATAALHILDNTSLANLLGKPLVVKAIGPNGSKDFTLDVAEIWSWSTGETFLIDVLCSIAIRWRTNLSNIRHLDPRTAAVVVEAIAYLAGLELATEGKHRAAVAS